jgi:beta-lactam-binding protein with PASTA domain
VSWPDAGRDSAPAARLKVPDVLGIDVRAASSKVFRTGLRVRLSGEPGTVIRTDPAAGTDVPAGQPVTLFTTSERATQPHD